MIDLLRRQSSKSSIHLRVNIIVAWVVMSLISCRGRSTANTVSESVGATASADATLPDIAKVGVPAVILWSEQRIKDAELSFKSSGRSRFPSPDFWGNEIFYEIMVDRFNDGDPSNNLRVVSPSQRLGVSNGNHGIGEYHHGGDLQGITNRLDYLADLGITSLWLTPIFMNASGAYHGYCVSDLTKLDPDFGTSQDLLKLTAAAHARGIRVVLDIVVNHICDAGTKYAQVHQSQDHTQCAADLDAADLRGIEATSPYQHELTFSSAFFPPFKLQRFLNRCGANSLEEMRSEGPLARFGDFSAEMLDFNTRDADFQAIYKNLMAYWIAYADVDGFRLDAVKHTTTDFSAYFATEIRQYANTLGKSHFYTVAEVAGSSRTISMHLGRMNPAINTQSWHHRVETQAQGGQSLGRVAAQFPAFPYPGVTGVYDFAHSGVSRDVLHNVRSSQVLEHYFRDDSYYQDLIGQGDPRLNLTVLEIHDWQRFADNSAKKSSLALSYLAVAPGIPVIYYGMEQGFNGACVRGTVDASVDAKDLEPSCFGPGSAQNDANYRQDMFRSGMFRLGSSLPQINALAHIGTIAAAGDLGGGVDPYLNRDHAVYKTARRFLKLRKSCQPLRVGDITWRWSTGDNAGFMAFTRVDPLHRSYEALVLINTTEQDLPIPDLAVENRQATFANLENPHDLAVPKNNAAGELSFASRRIPANSVMVYVPVAMVGPLSAVDGTHLCAQ